MTPPFRATITSGRARCPNRPVGSGSRDTSGRARCPDRAALFPAASCRLDQPLLLLACLLLLGLLLASAGCASRQNRRSLFSSPVVVDEIVLLAMPIALNLDRKPGVDGFAVKIFALNRSHPKSLPIRSGTLEILMFDGILTSLSTNTPRQVWSYPDSALPRYRSESAVGTSYSFSPQWGTNTPAQDKITVAARYTSQEGSPIFSASSVITVVSK